MPSVILGMSGGIDSSVCAHLLKQKGYDVTGIYLDLHEYSDSAPAFLAARHAGVELRVIDLRDEFSRIVKRDFIDEYAAGRTPSPCIVCNPQVKISALLEYADAHGFDYIATGHYARIVMKDGYFYPASAEDEHKDQSYMLSRLSQNQLSRLLTPLGEYTKNGVREIAKEENFPSFSGESFDICFIPDKNYKRFLSDNNIASEPGNFITPEGDVIGRHNGITHYTVGQRRGLGVALGERYFVCAIDPDTRDITLARTADTACVSAKIGDIHTHSPEVASCFSGHDRLFFRVRYSNKYEHGTIEAGCDNTANVYFDNPLRTVSPGQTCAVYVCENGIFRIICAGKILSAEYKKIPSFFS